MISWDSRSMRTSSDRLLRIQRCFPLRLASSETGAAGTISIMKMLERDLDSERWVEGSPERCNYEKAVVIYFNGWQFEGYDDAKAAILSSVLLSLGDHKRFGPKVRDKALDLLKSVDWMRVARFGFKHIAIPAAAALATGGVAAVPARSDGNRPKPVKAGR